MQAFDGPFSSILGFFHSRMTVKLIDGLGLLLFLVQIIESNVLRAVFVAGDVGAPLEMHFSAYWKQPREGPDCP